MSNPRFMRKKLIALAKNSAGKRPSAAAEKTASTVKSSYIRKINEKIAIYQEEIDTILKNKVTLNFLIIEKIHHTLQNAENHIPADVYLVYSHLQEKLNPFLCSDYDEAMRGTEEFHLKNLLFDIHAIYERWTFLAQKAFREIAVKKTNWRAYDTEKEIEEAKEMAVTSIYETEKIIYRILHILTDPKLFSVYMGLAKEKIQALCAINPSDKEFYAKEFITLNHLRRLHYIKINQPELAQQTLETCLEVLETVDDKNWKQKKQQAFEQDPKLAIQNTTPQPSVDSQAISIQSLRWCIDTYSPNYESAKQQFDEESARLKSEGHLQVLIDCYHRQIIYYRTHHAFADLQTIASLLNDVIVNIWQVNSTLPTNIAEMVSVYTIESFDCIIQFCFDEKNKKNPEETIALLNFILQCVNYVQFILTKKNAVEIPERAKAFVNYLECHYGCLREEVTQEIKTLQEELSRLKIEEDKRNAAYEALMLGEAIKPRVSLKKKTASADIEPITQGPIEAEAAPASQKVEPIDKDQLLYKKALQVLHAKHFGLAEQFILRYEQQTASKNDPICFLRIMVFKIDLKLMLSQQEMQLEKKLVLCNHFIELCRKLFETLQLFQEMYPLNKDLNRYMADLGDWYKPKIKTASNDITYIDKKIQNYLASLDKKMKELIESGAWFQGRPRNSKSVESNRRLNYLKLSPQFNVLNNQLQDLLLATPTVKPTPSWADLCEEEEDITKKASLPKKPTFAAFFKSQQPNQTVAGDSGCRDSRSMAKS